MPVTDRLELIASLVGLEKLQALDGALKSGTLSTNEMTKALKMQSVAVKETFTAQQILSGEAKQYTQTMVQQDAALKSVQKTMRSEGDFMQTMKGHIRESRQERRMLNFTVRESTAGLMALMMVMDSSGESTTGVSKKVKDASEAFIGLSFILTPVIGGFGYLAAAAGAAFMVFKGEGPDAIRKTADEIDKLNVSLGRMSPSEYATNVSRRVAEAAKERATPSIWQKAGTWLSSGAFMSFLSMAGPGQQALAGVAGGLLGGKLATTSQEKTKKDVEGEAEAHKANFAAISNEVAVMKARLSLQERQIELGIKGVDTDRVTVEQLIAAYRALIKLTPEEEKRLEIQKELLDLQRIAESKGLAAGVGLGTLVKGFTPKKKGVGLDFTTPDVGLQRTVEEVKDVSDAGQEEKEQTQVQLGYMTDALLSGFDAVGRSITDNVYNNLMRSFRQGKTLADQFIISILTGITSIATRLASSGIVSGILSLIPGLGGFASIFGGLTGLKIGAEGLTLNEPVFGIGARSGSGYLMGEAGPEELVPYGSYRGGGGMAQVVQAIEALPTRYRFTQYGRDMKATLERESFIERKRRI